MTNHHTKFEVPRPKGSLVITRKPFGLRTNGPTNAKQYTPSSLKWGIIFKKILTYTVPVPFSQISLYLSGACRFGLDLRVVLEESLKGEQLYIGEPASENAACETTWNQLVTYIEHL
jgi:hypothetical protein